MAKCVNSTTVPQVERRTHLRSIMLMAWSFRRADPARSFASCLRGAWKWSKGMAKEAARFMARARKGGGMVRLSSDLIRSPIRNSLRGKRDGRQADYQAAYMTSRLGS